MRQDHVVCVLDRDGEIILHRNMPEARSFDRAQYRLGRDAIERPTENSIPSPSMGKRRDGVALPSRSGITSASDVASVVKSLSSTEFSALDNRGPHR